MPFISVNELQIPYLLERSARVKRMRLEWAGHQARIIAPKRASNHEILAFLMSQKLWLGKQAAKSKAFSHPNLIVWPRSFQNDAFVPFMGTKLRICFDDWELNISRHKKNLRMNRSLDKKMEPLIIAWLKQEAHRIACHWGKKIGNKLELHPRSIKIKDQKSQWGSCGIHNDIHLNWRLICMPLPVFKYVIVHEYCHLKYRNHGKRFWALVAKIQPDFKAQEKWLRTYPSHMFLQK